jgi:ribonuclease D
MAKKKMHAVLHQKDIPPHLFDHVTSIAIDTEAMGLNPHRDRLCAVQISDGSGTCHVIQIERDQKEAPVLVGLLTNPSILKIFHFARFDVALLNHTFGIKVSPIYCTKIASRIGRTFVSRHGLKDLCRELLRVEISKEQQVSDWGQETLTAEQVQYAGSDVLYLHDLKEKLDKILLRENRQALAQSCFEFLPTCVDLDLLGYENLSIFNHN